jgi:hypothetical protein
MDKVRHSISVTRPPSMVKTRPHAWNFPTLTGKGCSHFRVCRLTTSPFLASAHQTPTGVGICLMFGLFVLYRFRSHNPLPFNINILSTVFKLSGMNFKHSRPITAQNSVRDRTAQLDRQPGKIGGSHVPDRTGGCHPESRTPVPSVRCQCHWQHYTCRVYRLCQHCVD